MPGAVVGAVAGPHASAWHILDENRTETCPLLIEAHAHRRWGSDEFQQQQQPVLEGKNLTQQAAGDSWQAARACAGRVLQNCTAGSWSGLFRQSSAPATVVHPTGKQECCHGPCYYYLA